MRIFMMVTCLKFLRLHPVQQYPFITYVLVSIQVQSFQLLRTLVYPTLLIRVLEFSETIFCHKFREQGINLLWTEFIWCLTTKWNHFLIIFDNTMTVVFLAGNSLNYAKRQLKYSAALWSKTKWDLNQSDPVHEVNFSAFWDYKAVSQVHGSQWICSWIWILPPSHLYWTRFPLVLSQVRCMLTGGTVLKECI